MPVVGAAAITGAAAVTGGVIQSKGASKAAKAQQEAADKAIAYEKERQAERRARYDAAYADYQKRYDAWVNQYFGGGKAPAPAGPEVKALGGGVRAMGAGTPAVSYGTPGAQGGDRIADLMRARGAIGSDAAARSGQLWGNTIASAGAGLGQAIGALPEKPKAVTPTLSDMGGWNDWNQYLRPRA